MREITIAGRKVGDGHPPFLIGEAGLNHCGDTGRALRMVGIAKTAGCDAVKFQTYRAAEFCKPNDPMFDTFKRCELEPDAWPLIKAECDRVGIMFMSTPQNRSDLDILLSVGIPAIKVGSDDFCNLPLIEDYAREGLPMILSCGMADWADIEQALYYLHHRSVVLMLCSSQYPCSPQETRIDRLRLLRGALPDVALGFSDHTTGSTAAAMAVALRACIFEKHFMVGDDVEGVPETFAMSPPGLATWVWTIRQAYQMMGDPGMNLTEAEEVAKHKYQRRSGQRLRGTA